jgi:prophage tail gpP-like protein
MPKPQEICIVQAGGTNYKFWKEVEVTRTASDIVSRATLVVAEIGDLNKGWKSIRLPPGAPVKITLAGELALTGAVTVRQVSYDGNSHNVRFVCQSNTAALAKSSLVLPPGQFKNQTLEKLANAATKKYGITFSLKGMPEGAQKVFERVSIHWGESPFQFILRLAQMRNIHIFDNAMGNLIGIRGGGQQVADLQEGRNILQAELVWSQDNAADTIKVDGDQHGTNAHWGDKARAQSAEAKNPNYNAKIPSPLLMVMPQPGDVKDAQMFANHSVDLNAATIFTANITVRGWQRQGGQLWLNEVGNLINLYSPMLLPQDRAKLGIQAATCRQNDSTGTTTTLELVLPDRLGGRDQISVGPNATPESAPSTAEPAQPKEEP